MANFTNTTHCPELTLEQKILLMDVKYWLEGVVQVLYYIRPLWIYITSSP